MVSLIFLCAAWLLSKWYISDTVDLIPHQCQHLVPGLCPLLPRRFSVYFPSHRCTIQPTAPGRARPGMWSDEHWCTTLCLIIGRVWEVHGTTAARVCRLCDEVPRFSSPRATAISPLPSRRNAPALRSRTPSIGRMTTGEPRYAVPQTSCPIGASVLTEPLGMLSC